MQIQKQDSGLGALLARLLPLIGQATGAAAGGPAGAMAGGSIGNGLEALLTPKNQEAEMIGGQPGMQSIEQQEPSGHMQQLLSALFDQLKGAQGQKEQMSEQGAPIEAEHQAEEGQKDALLGFLNNMSGEGKDLMLNYLRSIAFGQLNKGQ